MQLSEEEYDQLISKTVPVMHDVVRGFLLKYGGDEVEEIWDWVYDGIRAQSPSLIPHQRDLVAAYCVRSIHKRIEMRREGCHGIH